MRKHLVLGKSWAAEELNHLILLAEKSQRASRTLAFSSPIRTRRLRGAHAELRPMTTTALTRQSSEMLRVSSSSDDNPRPKICGKAR
jgi:hypothetical protein